MNGESFNSKLLEREKEGVKRHLRLTTPPKVEQKVVISERPAQQEKYDREVKLGPSELSQRTINLRNLIFQNTPISSKDPHATNNSEILKEIVSNNKFGIKYLFKQENSWCKMIHWIAF